MEVTNHVDTAPTPPTTTTTTPAKASPKPTRRVLAGFTNDGDGWLGDAVFAGMLTYTGAVSAGKAVLLYALLPVHFMYDYA